MRPIQHQYQIAKKRIKLIYFTPIFILLNFSAYAQSATKIKVSGKIADEKTGKTIEAATAAIFTIRTLNNGLPDTVMLSTVSDKNGLFIIKTNSGSNIELIVSAVGFEQYSKSLDLKDGETEVNAGTILLRAAAKNLENVIVTAKKPAMQLAVDRRIYNADAAITAKGGTAVDLMKNIPSLSVDINGGVQMRNATPQIFVDGRPTILTLEQIPADDIERVEIITNPSAKYDAASTGGIINIILKKNRRNGMNGIATVGIGTPNQLNGGISLNVRQNKLNFFVSSNYNRSGGNAKGEALRQNKTAGQVTDYFDQHTKSTRERRFVNVRFGVDYFIDKFNTLSVSQGFVDGNFNNPERQNQEYYNAQKELTQIGNRYTEDKFGFNRSNTQVNYRRIFEKVGKEWTADFTYSGGTNGGTGTIRNELFLPNGTPISTPNFVNNFADGSGDQFTFQTDFVNPFSENSKLEFGARSFTNISKDKFEAFSMNSGQSQKLPLSNNYSFKDIVNAVYINYSNAVGKLKYQGGFRAEQSSFKGNLIDSGKTFGYDFPSKKSGIWSALFPSAFLTYQLKEGNDLQLNFTRRIRRPNFWQINPYVDITDPMNISKGNPELQPEFTNSFELNYNRTYTSGSVLVSLYFRNNTADITEYSDTINARDLEQLASAGVSPNAIVTTFVNADRTNRSGLEITWQQKVGKSLDFTPSFNAQYRDTRANIMGKTLSNNGFNWSTKLTANYKIIKPDNAFLNNFSFQLMGEYQSARVIPQGKFKPQYSIDFAIKKDILKNNAGTITFNINDLLNSRRWGSITETDNFYQDSYRRWNVRSFKLVFSYRFGNSNLEIFKKKDSHSEEG
jgi:outer membrane receptor protein involved in Fe transport